MQLHMLVTHKGPNAAFIFNGLAGLAEDWTDIDISVALRGDEFSYSLTCTTEQIDLSELVQALEAQGATVSCSWH